MKLSILIAYLAGFISLLPTLAVAVIAGAVSWFGLRALYQTVLLIVS